MPKIPTFQAKGRITAEAGAVRTNIQVSPFQTPAGELSKVAKLLKIIISNKEITMTK